VQINPQLLNQLHAKLRRERFDAINPGSLLALIVLCDPAYRQTFCCPGMDQQSLEFVDKVSVASL
jgi:hypothetical protein